MLFGVQYKTIKDSVWSVDGNMRYAFDCVSSGELCYYCKNPILALKIAKQYNNKSTTKKYSIFKLSKEEESVVEKSRIVSSLEEYEDLYNKDNEYYELNK